MAASQRPKSTSTNKQGAGDEAISAVVERYTRDLERAPLAVRTRDAYGQHVGAYGAWLAGRPEPGVAITDTGNESWRFRHGLERKARKGA